MPLGGSGVVRAGAVGVSDGASAWESVDWTSGSGVSSLTRTSSSGPRPARCGPSSRGVHGTGRGWVARALDVHDSRFRAAFHDPTPALGGSVDEMWPQT